MTQALEALSRRWNDAGRQHAKDVQARLGRFHAGNVDDPELPDDLRDAALATQVLDAVIDCNRRGQWREARRWFDPAHEPLISKMGNQGLPFVVALGEDEALFRRGSTYQEGHLWRVAGDLLEPLPELMAAAISPNREMVALADAEGVRVLRGWKGPEVARWPWPSKEELTPAWVPEAAREQYEAGNPKSSLEYLCVADSGTRIAIASRGGILVGDASPRRTRWQLALPLHDEPDEYVLDELKKDERAGFRDDMVHVALSADGRFLACGTQDKGHFVLAIDPDGHTRVWVMVERASEYPHNACFSLDATHVAFNSCHFYSGSTIVAATRSIEVAGAEGHGEGPRTTLINGYLRVYASTWLPELALPEEKGAFALAGAGVLTIVTPTGEVLRELIFGSTGSGIDYCPTTKTLVLGSYSGFLHFLKPAEIDPFGVGWQPPKELKRWGFLENLPPFQW